MAREVLGSQGSLWLKPADQTAEAWPLVKVGDPISPSAIFFYILPPAVLKEQVLLLEIEMVVEVLL